VDDGFKVTVATPHLVPAECWNWLCYEPSFAPVYRPVPNPHINEWHNHNPPPGTVYDLWPRLNHPSLIDRADVVPVCENLHKLAPCDCRISNFLLRKEYHDQATYEQAMALYQAELPYGVTAMEMVAGTMLDKPDEYQKLMLPAAQLDPRNYYVLADYSIGRHDDDKAADYLDQAAASDPDSVRVANHSVWRVRYCVKKGQMEKARQIAADGGEVYSATGLEAEGVYYEAIHDYAEAFSWYAKDEERYNDSGALMNFCLRYKQTTGGKEFDAELQKRMNKLFPQGMEKASLGDFHEAPADGVAFNGQSALLTAAGLKFGDVIVAVYGIRVHNTEQYMYGRLSKDTPELDLIVWQGGAYREFKPSPPQHLFGVDLANYVRPQKQ
jgi:tetratricopeptide (TPR) repeat protein